MGDPAIAAYVRAGLEKTWSPDEIAGRMRVDYPRDPAMRISYETIYQWIWAEKARGASWHTYLRQGHRKRKRRKRRAQDRRGKIPNRTFIDQRPPSVDARRYFGDWESDTLVGAGRKGAICTHVERRSQYLILANAGSRNWRKVVSKSRAAFRRHEAIIPVPRRTMTVDNGQEFWGHKALSKALAVSVYFAQPHHPWERGLNEQVNGLIRQFLPKGRDLRPVTLRELKRIEGLLNNRPRKKLGYRTPLEVLRRRRRYASRA
jgi:IS30 family transposase